MVWSSSAFSISWISPAKGVSPKSTRHTYIFYLQTQPCSIDQELVRWLPLVCYPVCNSLEQRKKECHFYCNVRFRKQFLHDLSALLNSLRMTEEYQIHAGPKRGWQCQNYLEDIKISANLLIGSRNDLPSVHKREALEIVAMDLRTASFVPCNYFFAIDLVHPRCMQTSCLIQTYGFVVALDIYILSLCLIIDYLADSR